MKNLRLAVGAAGIALLAGVGLAQTGASPQSYPVRPIRIIVPNTAGSATDIATRLIAQRLTDSMGDELVALARAKPGQLNCAYPGGASRAHAQRVRALVASHQGGRAQA